MTDAPERIWMRYEPGCAVLRGPLTENPEYTEYIRADLHDTEVLRLRESEAALVRALKSVAADIKEYLADDTGTIALECALETIYRALADKEASHE